MSAGPGPLVVLLRHGETSWNSSSRFQGQHDTELAARGLQQADAAAHAIARAVAGHEVTLLSSDLRRARQTADAVADVLAVPVVSDPRLREIAAGAWQGLLQPEIEALDPAAFAAWRAGDDIALGGAERPSQAGARVRDAVLEHAAGLGEDHRLVVVGHGASIRSGLALLLGQAELHRVLVPLGNTGTAVLAGDAAPGQAWRLQGWNVPPSALAEVLQRRRRPSVSLT